MRRSFFYVSLVVLLLSCAAFLSTGCDDTSNGSAGINTPLLDLGLATVPSYGDGNTQPYKLATDPIQSFFQQQNSEMCGQTCIYMVASYYKVVGPKGTGLKYKYLMNSGYWYNRYLPTYSDCVGSSSTFTIYKWLDYVIGGMPVTKTSLGTRGALDEVEDFKVSSTSAYVFNTRYNSSSYPANVSATPYTTYDTTATTDAAVKASRLTYITTNYLNKGIPVIIHLDRSSGAGHYVVLAGNDGTNIYYVNPYDNNTSGTSCASIDTSGTSHLHKRLKSDFTGNTYWYACGGENGATWDGKWYTFYKR